MTDLSFDDWLEMGIRKGFTSPPVCYTHDAVPTTAVEDNLMEDGDDPCIFVMRPYQDTAEREEVEANHAPSQWRNPFRTLP